MRGNLFAQFLHHFRVIRITREVVPFPLVFRMIVQLLRPVTPAIVVSRRFFISLQQSIEARFQGWQKMLQRRCLLFCLLGQVVPPAEFQCFPVMGFALE